MECSYSPVSSIRSFQDKSAFHSTTASRFIPWQPDQAKT
ncbi:hypothetical protein ACP70R_032942 [Stipagrostis hirtigluma subsp. patula]